MQRGSRKRRWAVAGAAAWAALLLEGLPAGGVPLPPVRPAAEAQAPLPPPRPPEQGPPPPVALGPPMPPGPARPAAASPPELPAATPDEERICAALFSSGKVVARASAPVGRPGGCGIAAPVTVSAIMLTPARRVDLTPPVEVACGIAGAFADWVRDDLAGLFDKAERPLTGLVGTGGYSCRGRNRVAGAKLSEHAVGDAVDIGGFATAKGPVSLADSHGSLLADIRRTACARFSTVLGPGSDGFHEGHLHVDLIRRRNGFALCEWDLPGGDTGAKPKAAMPRPETARRGPL